MKRKIKVYLVLIAVALATLYLLDRLQACREAAWTPPPQEQQAPIKPQLYRAPILPIPFITKKMPVPQARLPIPAKKVDKTITVETPNEPPATIIISKSGDVYKTTDTPSSTKIKVVVWKRPFIEVSPCFSFSLVRAKDDWYVNVSYDILRIWRVYLGCDLGYGAQESQYLIGTSAKIHILGSRPALSLVAGKNWMNSAFYVGVNLRWESGL